MSFRADTALEQLDRDIVVSQPEPSHVVEEVLRTVRELRDVTTTV